MKIEYHTEVRSTAEQLWDILTDVQAWPESQGVICMEPPSGPLAEGSCFAAKGGGVEWSILVTEVDRPRRLVWVGRRLGLTAIREWEFEEASGKTRVLNREQISGWMLPLLYPFVKKGMARTAEMWSASLKSRAESA